MTESELMLTSVLDCRRVDLAAYKNDLTPVQKTRYDRMLARRAKGEPLQYVLGQWDFMGVPLFTDQRALIPRPETEILVELAIEKIGSLSRNKKMSALDLGSGSGNITVALLKCFSDMTVKALDVSEDALVLARENAKLNGVEHRVDFLCCDMGGYLKRTAGLEKTFDLVVSNPPYISTGQLALLPEDVQHEPRLALDGGRDGLKFYRTIIKYAWQVLETQGFLVMEIGDGQRNAIGAIFAQYPQYQGIKFYKDYVGTDRIVVAEMNILWKN